ncbi:DUF1559 domain-containing protein [Lentisphaerota bacterium WC36G]|nr:DUF1559 domain-containing protein [Lentisphaerae bacterium WC36]
MKFKTRKSYFNLSELAVVVFILAISGVVFTGCLSSAFDAAREKARQISCASNLKQIGTAFAMFSLENDDIMPRVTAPHSTIDPIEYLTKKYGKPMAKGYFKNSKLAGTSAGNFEELRRCGVLKDPKLFHCPSTLTQTASDNKALNNDSCSYAYAFGMVAGSSSIMGMPDSGIAADGVNITNDYTFKPNHTDFNNNRAIVSYGNILRLDNSVIGCKGKKWYTNSGMWQKKVPTRILQSTNEMFDN